jgi:KipI family sensor histidine kinase inhibitor
MRLIDVGDRAVAVILEAADAANLPARVGELARRLAECLPEGVTDVVASPGRVTVIYDPLRMPDLALLRSWIGPRATAQADATQPAAASHEIPVCYGGGLGPCLGPDLAEVCDLHGIDRDRLVALHAGADYVVEAIGFMPGFGYLAGLPAELATPRRSTPRRVVPAGSVGIGAGQTGAYPFASPGGWNLIGATPARLFDATRDRPALLAIGDRVRFRAIERGEFSGLARREPEPVAARAATGGFTVLRPGLCTTIQDLGRPGHRAAGVPWSGAADPWALRLANRFVGNPDAAAAVEITLLGPSLRFEQDAVVAVAGAEFPGLPAGRPVTVRAGETLALGHAVTGCRGYLAVAGGIDVAPVLGSRSTFLPAAFGGLHGLPLAAGDLVPIGPDRGPAAAHAADAGTMATPSAGPVTLRVIPGEQFSLAGAALWSATHTVSSRSDRMGVRLDGSALGGGAGGSLPSVAVLPGTVQLPPDGRPIILLADAPTIGGYPVIGHVIAADLPLVAQARPGTPIRWRETTIAEAHRALRQRAADHGVTT